MGYDHSVNCYSFEDRVLVEFIHGYPIFKCVAVTWQGWEGTSVVVWAMATRRHALLWLVFLCAHSFHSADYLCANQSLDTTLALLQTETAKAEEEAEVGDNESVRLSVLALIFFSYTLYYSDVTSELRHLKSSATLNVCSMACSV